MENNNMDNNEKTPETRRYNWNKIAVILILAGVALFAIGRLSGARGGGISFSGWRFHVHNESTQFENSFTPLPARLENISVRTTSISVIIQTAPAGETPGIHLVNVNPESLEAGDGITIDTRRAERTGWSIWLFNWNFTAARREIRIYLPANAELNEVSVRSTSGSVQIDGLSAENITTDSTSGSLRLNNLQAQTLYARAVSGSIRGENINISSGEINSTSGSISFGEITWNTLDARSTSGSVRFSDARIQDAATGRTSLRSTSGSVHLELREPAAYFSYNMSTTSGTARVNGNNRGRGTSTGGTGAHEITLRTTSGSVRLDFE